MHKLIFFIRTSCLFIIFALGIKAESQNITLSGYIKDARTKESLIGANIFSADTKKGTSTNEYGFYSLTLPKKDTLSLAISYIGYIMQMEKITTADNLRLDFFLDVNSAQLGEVVINAERNDNNVNKPQIGVIDVPIKAVTSMAVLAGEKDILKTIQFLPGVQQGQEGTTG
jgi:hypothetical protein